MSRAHTGLVLHSDSRHNGQYTDFRTILENRCTCAGRGRPSVIHLYHKRVAGALPAFTKQQAFDKKTLL